MRSQARQGLGQRMTMANVPDIVLISEVEYKQQITEALEEISSLLNDLDANFLFCLHIWQKRKKVNTF